MSSPRPIAFLDSGVGGLPYLEWVRQRLSTENYVYLADNEGFPYGTKPAAEVVRIVVDRVKRMIQAADPKLVVIACNTASVAALAELRRRFDVPFVGVVPAVKPAAENSVNRRIGLLATNGTISDTYTDRLITDFASSCSVLRIGAGEIVEFVETRYLESDEEQRQSAVSPTVQKIVDASIDTLVIGCTHFVYIEDNLQAGLNGTVRIVDSREGVGKQIMRLTERIGRGNGIEYSRFYTTTGGGKDRFESFAAHFDLEFCGVLES
jgi:glutamate racemase